MPAVGDIEGGAGRIVAEGLSDKVLGTYLGHRFERVCSQWLLEESLAGRLPIRASSFGQWWGTDPALRQQDDVDVVAADRASKTALIGECKWRNSFDETEVLEKLHHRADLVKGYRIEFFYLFSKNPLSTATLRKMKASGNEFSVTLDDLYRHR